jgi:hydroxypyruvate reductase
LDPVKLVIQQILAQGAFALTRNVLLDELSFNAHFPNSKTFCANAKSCSLVAIGKASLAMAYAAHQVLGDRIQRGLVIYPKGYANASCRQAEMPLVNQQQQPQLSALPAHFQLIASAHPVPQVESIQAASALIAFLEFDPSCPYLFLISGGTSSLVELPKDPFTLDQIQETTRQLLSCEIPIEQINGVRSLMSHIKGGGLGRWLPTDIPHWQLSISDVSNDDPSIIGSGLLFPAKRQINSALLSQFNLPLTRVSHGHQIHRRTINHRVVGNSRQLAEAVFNELKLKLGLSGQVEEINATLDQGVERAQQWYRQTEQGIFVMHGEVTLNLPQTTGLGGRCSHFALRIAQFLSQQEKPAVFIALATDGADGNTNGAGGWVDNQSWKHLETMGMDPLLQLSSYNSYTALKTIDHDLSFPRGYTNVRDIYVFIKYTP